MTAADRLKDKIEERGMPMTTVANRSGILRQTLYNRLNGVGDFTASEIISLSTALRLTQEERDEIFFADEVEYRFNPKKNANETN